MAQFVVCPTGDQEVMGLTPPGRQRSGVEIEHEISSVVILCLLLIQEGQLSVFCERMCTILVNQVMNLTPSGRQHSGMETEHEIFSTVILCLLLIQEGQLSVSGEGMCTLLVNLLEG